MLLLVIESARFRDSTATSSGGQPQLHGRGSFCRGLFGFFAQDYTGRWIHVVDLAAYGAGHRLIDVLVLRDVLSNEALNALSG
jgi:hypothetical protein